MTSTWDVSPAVANAPSDLEGLAHWTSTGSAYHGDPRFYRLLAELAILHSEKNHDYSKAEDPFSNFRMSEALGVEAWRGVLVRMSDKWARIEQLVSGKSPKNESVEDSLRDLAVYALICVLLRREATAP